MSKKSVAKKSVPSLFILVFMISVGPFGDTLYTPSLPDIATSLNTYYNNVQLTITTYLLGYALSQLAYGPLSDRYGRKPVMIIGAAIFVLGSLICAFSFDISILIAGRFIQGLGACAGAVLSSAAVRDAFPESKQGAVFAKINLAFAIAPGLGPIVGSFTAHNFSWHVNFMILLILGFLLLILVIIMFPETLAQKNHHAIHPKKIVMNYLSLFKADGYFVYLCLLGISLGILYSCLIEAPGLVIDTMHLNPSWFMIIALSIMVAFMIGSVICNYLCGRLDDDIILISGMTIIMVSSIIFFFIMYLAPLSLWTLLIPFVLIFIGVAFIIPVATMKALAPFNDIVGSASAMMGFFQMGFASLVTAIVTFIDVYLGNIFTMPVSFFILSFIGLSIICGYVLMKNKVKC
ncbi:MAG: DHA1 family bicyclomycin/chloramphenicol resistance-like MFS transporter [Francisellaceae bacterium]|jgi:DHA1 family bicyclomycin/chloramphenicol resistance-like MFS transporter